MGELDSSLPTLIGPRPSLPHPPSPRMCRHSDALRIYVHRLRALPLAEAYCDRVFARRQQRQRQQRHALLTAASRRRRQAAATAADGGDAGYGGGGRSLRFGEGDGGEAAGAPGIGLQMPTSNGSGGGDRGDEDGKDIYLLLVQVRGSALGLLQSLVGRHRCCCCCCFAPAILCLEITTPWRSLPILLPPHMLAAAAAAGAAGGGGGGGGQWRRLPPRAARPRPRGVGRGGGGAEPQAGRHPRAAGPGPAAGRGARCACGGRGQCVACALWLACPFPFGGGSGCRRLAALCLLAFPVTAVALPLLARLASPHAPSFGLAVGDPAATKHSSD